MSDKPGVEGFIRKPRPLWQVPLVTALVLIAAILVLYPSG